MKHIELNLGYLCNNNCLFCMSGITKTKLTKFEEFEVLKNEIINLKTKGYTSIGFLGGEPTIHPNFLEIVEFTKNNGFNNIEVVSNGLKFADKKFLINAIKSGITRIGISIHSINNKEEEILTGGIPGILVNKINAVKNIIDCYDKGLLNKEISISTVISKINYKGIKKLILFLYKIGVKSFRINFIQLEGNSTKNYDLLAIKYEEFEENFLDIIGLNKQFSDIRINFEAIPWCFSGLDYNEYLKYGEQNSDREKDKISRDDIDLKSRDIINQLDRRKELKGYLKKCDKCKIKGECEGIWRRYINFFKLK